MHEVSICQSILKTIEGEYDTGQLQDIREIHLKVGELSCVQPQVLEHVFKFVAADGPFENAVLKIERIGITAECEYCRRSFKVNDYRFVCPECDKPTSKIIEGKELLIYKIIFTEQLYEEVK